MADPFEALLAEEDPAGLVERALVRWIAREFDDQWNACLDAIGTPPEQKAPLAKVFVDLAETEPKDDVPLDAYPQEPPSPGVLAKLLARAPQLSGSPRAPRSVPLLEERGDDGGPHVVIIGGPGQGKTTLVQFLCQVHRASFLETRRDALEAPQHHALDLLRARCVRDAFPVPTRPCLPLHVTLREFAAERRTSPEPAAALFDHLRAHICAASGAEIDTTSLDAILRAGPWLLVLDGLDEVSASTARDGAMAAVSAFLERYAGTAHLVVATTRPQGYRGEFGDFAMLHLAPLSRRRALWYARDLVDQWYPDEVGTRARLLERLLHASREGGTARLMQTPLQVTIMAALLLRIARAPHERWRLFKDYYTTIYNRELGRHTEAAETLRTLRPHIDAIHQQVALHLQVACEREGGTDALLSAEEVTRIAEARLAREGFDPQRRVELARKIVEAAETRLVFLVSPRKGRYGFELRSLQEFMAAEGLMSGREQAVLDRMRRIARASAWRNVLLFAVSWCFATASELTEALTDDLCAWLDESSDDLASVATRAGATLALEILEEGSALYYPAATLRLLTRSLGTLPEDDSIAGVQIASLMEVLAREPDVAEEARHLVFDAVRREVLDPNRYSFSAWRILLGACLRGDVEADRLADQAWNAPHTLREALLAGGLLAGLKFGDLPAWIAPAVAAFPPALRTYGLDSIAILRERVSARQAWLVRATTRFFGILKAPSSTDACAEAVDDLMTTLEERDDLSLFVLGVSTQLPRDLAASVLRNMLGHSEVAPESRSFVRMCLRFFVKGALSGLDSPDLWRALQLPDPPPPHDPIARTAADLDEGPVRIESIMLEGVRGFERFELHPAQPDNGHGQWIILIGENGVGKTTVLRALALALVPTALATVALTQLPAPLRREGALRCEVHVKVRGLHARIRVDQSGEQEVVAPEGDVPERYPFVVAYGCRRGTAVGGPERALLHEPFHDIHTLFDDTQSGINHAESWLKRLHHRSLEDPTGAAPRILSEVLSVLRALLPGVDTIEVQSRDVWFEGPAIGRVRLGGLSDGYVTTAGWVCDLMARWLHRMDRSEQEIPPAFPSQMTGLVLLDEIDLNLHPRWQLDVIESVRAQFGRLSFVVTTHNALTLLGAHAGELQVLHGVRGAVSARQLDVPKGLRADQVLTGAWFGVTSTVDPETIELLARHRARIRGGAKPGDPSVAELEAEIRRRLGTFDPDALDRLTAWKEDPSVETDVARREAVAADVREQLRARRKKA